MLLHLAQDPLVGRIAKPVSVGDAPRSKVAAPASAWILQFGNRDQSAQVIEDFWQLPDPLGVGEHARALASTAKAEASTSV